MTLTTSELNGVVVTLGRGVSIPVQLRIDGDQTPVARDLSQIELGLKPVGGGLQPEVGIDRFDANGLATISRVLPGDYRVVVNIPESLGLYIRDARHQSTDALNGVWQITNETSGPLNVTLGARGGQIEGTLRDVMSHAVPGVQVVLIPDQTGDRLDLYKRTTTDSEGHFLFRGIAPAGYKVFAGEALEQYAYYHNDVLSLYETQGVPVQVQDSVKATIVVRLIPAPKQ